MICDITPVPLRCYVKSLNVVVQFDGIAIFLALLALVVLAAALIRPLVAFLGQPPVIADICAGLLIGPSALGSFVPAISAPFINPHALAILDGAGVLGVVAYMFATGLGLRDDSQNCEHRTMQRIVAVVLIACGTTLAPLAFGILVASELSSLAGEAGSGPAFALFLGVVFAITAVPVLSRMLDAIPSVPRELRWIALTVAAINDAVIWILVIIVSLAVPSIGTSGEGVDFATIAYAIGMAVLAVLLIRFSRPVASLRAAMPSLLLAAAASQAIGLHAIIGAFACGIVMRSEPVSKATEAIKSNPFTSLLLQAFFASVGLRLDLSTLSASGSGVVVAVIVASITVKYMGTFLAARAAAIGRRNAHGLAIALNSRGLVEVVILNIGLTLGLVSQDFFALMLIASLLVTMIVPVLLRLTFTQSPINNLPRVIKPTSMPDQL